MKYIITIISITLICACSENQSRVSVITAFKKNEKLTANVLKISNPILLPRYMCISDDKLFIYKEKDDNLFEIFDLPNCDYKGSAGVRGQGPNDFGLLDPRSFQTIENGFKVLEVGSNLYKTVLLEDNRLSVSGMERIFEDHTVNNGFYFLIDNVYLTMGNIGEQNEYGLYDKKTSTLKKTGNYPEWTTFEIKDPVQLFMIYLKTCVVHPDGKKFASFYGRFKRLRVYDDSANLLHDINVKIKPYSDGSEKGMEDGLTYYGQPCAIGNYIYAPCLNLKRKYPEENTSELHVWDWNGNPVACYNLDKKVSYIAISEKYKKLYAMSVFEDDELYVYEVPELEND